MSIKKRVSLFVCLLNLVPMLNANIGIKAMDPKDSLNLCISNSSEFFKQYEDISLEDKKSMMNKFKENKNWELQKEIEKGEYNYQTADSINIFSFNDGQTSYVLKILLLKENKSFESEKLAFEKLNSCPKWTKNFNVFSPVYVGSYKNEKTEVYYVIYEYAGENKRNSENLSNEQKIKIWNSIVQKKCRALLFLLSKGIMHCDPNYNNWIIQYENSNQEVMVKLIDFGSCIDISNKPKVPLYYVSPFYGNDPATNRGLRYLLDSLSYDLCDLLSISHDKKDIEDYGIFSGVKKMLDEIFTNAFFNFNKPGEKVNGVMSLSKYKELLGKILVTLTIH